MARVRVAVALLLPRRTSDEVDGIRRAFGSAPLRRIVVSARVGGRLVGVASGNTGGRSAVLDVVLVAEGRRRHGIGTHLLATLEHEAAHRGVVVIEAPDDLGPEVDALLEGRGWTERPGPGGPRLWRALGPDHPGPR